MKIKAKNGKNLISDIRDQFPTERQPELTRALIRSHLAGLIKMMRQDDPNRITERDQMACVEIAGCEFHHFYV